MHEGDGFFRQKLFVKTYFIVKMTSPAMDQPASSDFMKAPRVWGQSGSGFFSDEEVHICSGYNHQAVVAQPFY